MKELMQKHTTVAQLVKEAYESSSEDFAQWMWRNHVPVVAEKTLTLAKQYGAKADIAVAGAWLHDFGDAFVYRFDERHDEVTETKSRKVLQQASYSPEEIRQVMEEVLSPHSCRDNNLPTTLEGKVMATGDALGHLDTDFYLQFCWKHLPDGLSYAEFLEWVAEKIQRDFHKKIFFEDVKSSMSQRYNALKEVFLMENMLIRDN